MLSTVENDKMCRVEGQAAQGEAIRRFWIPALMSRELPHPDCDPIRVQILGEDLVAFRDSDGKVGLLDEYCRHRGASLTLGRVEGHGIRCLYHGWKFDREGKVLETPNVADPKFKERIRAKAYAVQEAGGLVWIYMGDEARRPPFPHFPFMDVAKPNVLTAMAVVEANFVQVIEGLVDSSHLTILHTVGLKKANEDGGTFDFAKKSKHMKFDAAPRVEAEETPFGFQYAAIRTVDGPEGGKEIIGRVASFQSPCFVWNPNGDLWFAVVPMSDTRTMFFHVWWSDDKNLGEEPLSSQQLDFVGLDDESLDRHGMSRKTYLSPDRAARHNNFMQDRDALRRGHFTGIWSFTQEDAIMAASSGAIRDRSKEVLSVADIAINRLYRVLLNNASAAAEGRDPIGLDADGMTIKGATGHLALGDDWRNLTRTHTAARAVAK